METQDRDLTEYRNLLQDLQIKSLQSYDKAVMTLSGGALGISFAFIKELTDVSIISFKSLLIISWSCWALSILAVLVSFFFSHLALNKAIENIDSGNDDNENLGGAFDTMTKITNISSGLLFIIGTVCMVIFSANNI